MGASVGTGKGPISDINVTPLIDVVLVLLVVFMVITPLLQSGQQVDLPEATETVQINDAGQQIVVSVTKERGWWLDQEQVDKDTIIPAINTWYREHDCSGRDKDPMVCTIAVKADRSLEYGQVREVLDILAENRFTSVFIAAAKEK
jgi:biopolymer transport protein ExbD